MLRIGKIEIPDSELTFEFARSAGPGGQNVNKVETKVTVRFTPRTSSALTPPQIIRIEAKLASRLTKNGDLLVSSELTRHREQNREDALKRLADLIRDALKVQKKRRPTRPTRASKERRLKGKKRKSSKKNLRRPPESE
jgi:ribosome-associated protein